MESKIKDETYEIDGIEESINASEINLLDIEEEIVTKANNIIKEEDPLGDNNDFEKIGNNYMLGSNEIHINPKNKLRKSKDKVSSDSSSIEHINENVKYSCNQCDYPAKDPYCLKYHVDFRHRGIRYPCDKCDYLAGSTASLKKHKQVRHEGVQHPCNLCDYTAKRIYTLKKHQNRMHNSFPCDMCNHHASTPKYLKCPKKRMHEGILYPCNICKYKAMRLSTLKYHTECKHRGRGYPLNPYEAAIHERKRNAIEEEQEHKKDLALHMVLIKAKISKLEAELVEVEAKKLD